MDVEELIKALPKAEQHIHIVGSTRPATLLWLVDKGRLEAPFGNVEEVEDYFSYSDFPHFIRVYSKVADSITEEDQFERLTYARASGRRSPASKWSASAMGQQLLETLGWRTSSGREV